jgi:hypothetical protein
MNHNLNNDQNCKSHDDVSDVSETKQTLKFSTERSVYVNIVENDLAKYNIPEILIFGLKPHSLKLNESVERIIMAYFGVREDSSAENRKHQLCRLLNKLAEREQLLPQLLENFELMLEDLKSTRVGVECDKRKMMNILMQKQREIDELKTKIRPAEQQLELLRAENLELNERMILTKNKLDHKKVMLHAIKHRQQNSSHNSSKNWQDEDQVQKQKACDIQMGKAQLGELSKEKKEMADEIDILTNKISKINAELKTLRENRGNLEKRLEKSENKINSYHSRLRSMKGSGALNISLERAQESDFHVLIKEIQDLQKEKDIEIKEVQRMLDEEESLRQQLGKHQVTQKRLRAKLLAQERTMRAFALKIQEISTSYVKNSSISDISKPPKRDFSRSQTRKSRDSRNEEIYESVEGDESINILGSLKRNESIISPINHPLRKSTAARRNISVDFLLANPEQNKSIRGRIVILAAKVISFEEKLQEDLDKAKERIKGFSKFIEQGMVVEKNENIKSNKTKLTNVQKLHKFSVGLFLKLSLAFKSIGLDISDNESVDKLVKQIQRLLKDNCSHSQQAFYSERVLKCQPMSKTQNIEWARKLDEAKPPRWVANTHYQLNTCLYGNKPL